MSDTPNVTLGMVSLRGCRCRCGHEWLPRLPTRPRVCPKCKSALWDRPFKFRRGPPSRHDIRVTAAEPSDGRVKLLREMFPDAVTDGAIDFDRLRRLLGGDVTSGPQQYGLVWPGKHDAIEAARATSTMALSPDEGSSVDFETTDNLIIEGDNLEVLRLLQAGYAGQVKVVYLDPPYNTGQGITYSDQFAMDEQEYRQLTGTRPGKAIRLHSGWLSMMYPRLLLARDLLSPDGILLASISDHEVTSLRLLLDEIMGEQHFLGQLVWRRKKNPDARAKTGVATDHEYILAYRKTDGAAFRGEARTLSRYDNPDNDLRGPWTSRSILGLAARNRRPRLHYDLVDPQTARRYSPPQHTGWRYSEERMRQLLRERRILFPTTPDGRPREKSFWADLEPFVPFASVIDDVHTGDGTREIFQLFGFRAFAFAKPTELLRRLVEQTTSDDDLVVDLFAGSGTIGHAVLLQNARDGGRRRYCLVQQAAPVPPGSLADQHGLPDVAAICMQRMRLAAEQVDVNDCGFRVFRLREPVMRVRRGRLEAPRDIDKPEDVVWELLHHLGLPLSAGVEAWAFEGKDFYVLDGSVVVCLEERLTDEDVLGMADIEAKPTVAICRRGALSARARRRAVKILGRVELRTV